MLTLILLVFAFVLLVVAGVVGGPGPAPSPWGWRLLCYGLACWVLTEIIGRGPALLH